MASSTEASATDSTKTPAQLLAEQHETHHVTVEDVVDEEDIVHPPPSHTEAGETETAGNATNGVMSAKAAGKQKATERSGVIDTQDEEAFPTLGAGSKPSGKAPGWGSKGSLKTSGSPALTGASTPKGAASRGPAISGINLPNKNRDHLDVEFDDINKSVAIKKVLDDAKRKHKVITSFQEIEAGRKKVLRFTAEGPQRNGVRDALLDISRAVSIEKIFKIEVSPNVSSTIIGRGGANIRKLQADHGVRINIEREQPSSTGGPDEKVDIVEIKGDYAGARSVFNKITSMKKEMQPKVDLPLKNIAPELYPFIASRHAAEIQKLQDDHGLSIDVPQYHTWRAQPPPRPEPRPAFVPHGDSFITLSGEQDAAATAKQVLESIAERIAQELILEELTCEQVLHPYIVGERGMDPLEFLEQTGCAIILPPGHEETDDIHIIGPEDRIEDARNLVEQLMSQKYNRPVDVGRQFANAPMGPERHSRALAQYLQKKALEREFMSAHNSEVIFPIHPNAAPSWSVISSDQQKAVSAKNDLMKIAQAFPTSRIQLLEMDPYYHPHIGDMFSQQLQDDHGVFMIVPDDSEDHVVLVYEGPSQDTPFALPRQKPTSAEQKEFERALMAAQEFLFNSIPSREVAASEMPIPRKHHDRVRRFVKSEQQGTPSPFPIQFDFGETRGKRSRAQQAPENVSMRGPSVDEIEALRQRIEAFLVEVEQDEKERDYVTTCDFPEKFVKNLVGKNGANIKALREKHDVEIQTGEAGVVKIQGPQKKADACKQEIMRLGKQFEDEVSYSITVDRKLHGELIGKGGETLNKLQSKVNNEVRIDFPRAPRAGDADENASEVGGTQKQGPNEIRIRGPRAKADKVREELLSLAQYLQDNSHVATVSVDKDQIPSLIGKQGAELNKLREETGATIDIPDRSSATDRVEITLKGTKAAVDKARQEIARRSKAFDSIITKTVTVDKKWHRDLIGTGGANIQNIVTAAGGPAKSAEAVQFPKKGEDGSTLTIKGTSDVVDKIVTAIQTFVEDKEGQVTDFVDVPQDQHRLLIGTGGNIRKSIEQQFNVLIDIPRRDSNKTDVKIAGRPEGVAQAKEHIISLTKQPEGTTIMVPRSVHHTIADGGRIFRDLSRQGIKIDHKGQQPPRKPQSDGAAARRSNNADAPLITDDPSEGQQFSFEIVSSNAGSEAETGEIPWVLIGGREVTEENIAKAQKRIEEAISRAKEPRCTGYLRLADPRLHRHVIGRGGSTINSIRKQTDCDIQVPGGNKSQNNSEEITIIGAEEGVLLAKDLIMQEIEKAG